MNVLQGVCLGTQDDITDTTTNCYTTCNGAAQYLSNIFNTNSYSGSTFNAAGAMNYFSIFSIKLMNAFDACGYTTFMVMFNDRLSDWSFAGGMFANLATQLALYPLSSIQSPIYKSWN